MTSDQIRAIAKSQVEQRHRSKFLPANRNGPFMEWFNVAEVDHYADEN